MESEQTYIQNQTEEAEITASNFESPAFREALEKLNNVLEDLKRQGKYGGENITIENFEIKRFPEMTHAHGGVSQVEEKISMLPSSMYTPAIVIHEGLHFASNWRFWQKNKLGKFHEYQSGFSIKRGVNEEEEYRDLNEGFTEFFARRFSEGMEDEYDDHKDEMIQLCEKQYDDESAKVTKWIKDLKKIDPRTSAEQIDLDFYEKVRASLEQKKVDWLFLLSEKRPKPYEAEAIFVHSYLLRKAEKRLKSTNGPSRPFKEIFKDIVDEALVAYINGDNIFLSDLDEIFGADFTKDLQEAQKSGDFMSILIKYT